MDDMLTLVAEVDLFAGPIVSSTLSSDDKWLYAAGDEERGSRVRAWKLDGGGERENRVRNVGGLCPETWHVHCTRENRLFMSMRKDDAKAYGEAWDVNDME